MASISTDSTDQQQATCTSNVKLASHCERILGESGYPVLGKLVCSSGAAGEIQIRGLVGSYFLKQMAQTLVSRVEGVEQIDNLVEVSSR